MTMDDLHLFSMEKIIQKCWIRDVIDAAACINEVEFCGHPPWTLILFLDSINPWDEDQLRVIYDFYRYSPTKIRTANEVIDLDAGRQTCDFNFLPGFTYRDRPPLA